MGNGLSLQFKRAAVLLPRDVRRKTQKALHTATSSCFIFFHMKVSAIVGVKDEADLVLAATEHLERIGVQEIVFYDADSTDGTAQILAGLVDAGRIRLWVQNDLEISPADDLRLRLELIRSCRSEWVMGIDVDEFLLVAGGDIRYCPELQSNAFDFVQIPRRNVLLRPEGLAMQLPPTDQAPEDIWVLADPIRNFWSNPALARENPWTHSAVLPKMLGRRDHVLSISHGLHHFGSDASARRTRASSMFIAHVPLTTYTRFETKVGNIDKLLSLHPEESKIMAFHWSRWRQIYLNGGLPAEFAWQITSDAQLAELRARGMASSAAEFLARLASEPDLAA